MLWLEDTEYAKAWSGQGWAFKTWEGLHLAEAKGVKGVGERQGGGAGGPDSMKSSSARESFGAQSSWRQPA